MGHGSNRSGAPRRAGHVLRRIRRKPICTPPRWVFAASSLCYNERSRSGRGRSAQRPATAPTQRRHPHPAYRLYQLGRHETYKRTAGSPERAIEYFEEAIQSDRNYAQAYAGLAQAYVAQHFIAGRSRKEALLQARPLAERAIQLDPTLAEGYAALGIINTWDRQSTAAERNFDTAIALNPGLAQSRIEYGGLLWQSL